MPRVGSGMVSQYPAELPGSTAEVLHSSMPDTTLPPISRASAPVAAVSNVDAMLLHTQPGVPDISGKPEKKVKEKGISYFSLFRWGQCTLGLLLNVQHC